MSWSYFEPAFPLALALLFAAVIGAWFTRRRRKPWLLTLGFLASFLLSWLPFAWWAAQPLERWYPPRTVAPRDVQAIVVLSGNVLKPEPERPFFLPGYDTFKRTRYAAWFYENRLQVPVLACGGGMLKEPFSQAMKDILVHFGVPEGQIWLETRSQSTYENALFGARILRSHGVSRIVLIEEAYCLPRAAACFRKQGLTVVPIASEYTPQPSEVQDFFPNGKAIEYNADTLHEMLGLAWYRLRGWI